MIWILASADDNFKITIRNVLKVLKEIKTEWENREGITAEQWKVDEKSTMTEKYCICYEKFTLGLAIVHTLQKKESL